jgi:DNA-directed RNA polymerase specialized sigma24 family protein
MSQEIEAMIEEIIHRLRAEGVQIDDLQKLRVAVGFRQEHAGERITINALPKQRALLRLHEVGTQGSTREIADRAGMPVRTVRWLMRGK